MEPNVKSNIQRLVSENKIEDAIRAFLDWAVKKGDTDLENSLLVIQSRYSRLRQQEMLGVIQFSEAVREQAIVSSSILDFLKKAETVAVNPLTLSEDGPATTDRRVILFLASNPSETAKLQLEKEFVRIARSLQESTQEFKLVAEWAVTPLDLQRAILKHRPSILHFSGHGQTDGTPGSRGVRTPGSGPASEMKSGIVLQSPDGKPQFVRGSALADMFRVFSMKFNIKIVILNACHSEEQARAISQHVKYVIGMNEAIDDNAAIEFSTGFYNGIAADEDDIAFSFELAKNNIQLQGLDDDQVPVIYEQGR